MMARTCRAAPACRGARGGRPRDAWTAAASLGCWLVAASASAQTYTVLPVERDGDVSADIRRAAGEAVRGAPAFGSDAVRVDRAALLDKLPQADRSLVGCSEVDCAARLAHLAELDFAVTVAVWPGGDARPATVAVALVSPDGTVREADAPVTGQVRQGATAALMEAARRWARGADPAKVGVAPRSPDGAGADGAGEAAVDEAAIDEAAVDEAAPGGAAPGGAAPDRAREDTAPIAPPPASINPALLGPVLLGVAGLVGLGVVAGTYAAAGCDEREAAGCVAGRRVEPVPTALYGAAGGAAVLGAILWYLLGGGNGGGDQPAVAPGPSPLGLQARF